MYTQQTNTWSVSYNDSGDYWILLMFSISQSRFTASAFCRPLRNEGQKQSLPKLFAGDMILFKKRFLKLFLYIIIFFNQFDVGFIQTPRLFSILASLYPILSSHLLDVVLLSYLRFANRSLIVPLSPFWKVFVPSIRLTGNVTCSLARSFATRLTISATLLCFLSHLFVTRP